MPELPSPKEFLRRLKPRLPQMLATLRQFVEAESPSLEKAAADRCYGLIASAWRKYDVRVERLAQKHRIAQAQEHDQRRRDGRSQHPPGHDVGRVVDPEIDATEADEKNHEYCEDDEVNLYAALGYELSEQRR